MIYGSFSNKMAFACAQIVALQHSRPRSAHGKPYPSARREGAAKEAGTEHRVWPRSAKRSPA